MTNDAQVSQISEAELADILGTGTPSIMVPGEEKKPGFFSKPDDTAFLDKPIQKATETQDEPDAGDDNIPAASDSDDTFSDSNPDLDVLNIDADKDVTKRVHNSDDDDDDSPSEAKGSTMAKMASGLIEKGLFVPFEGEDDLSKYKFKDYQELFEMNLKKIKDDASADVQEDIFNSWPEELQYAVHYVQQGGKDLKQLFQAMSASQEIGQLDVSTEHNQENVVRAYLQVTQYGNQEEIEDEIVSLKDRGDLEKKSKQFHPKLKSMQDKVIQQRIAVQEQQNVKRQEQSQLYYDSVYKTLEKGDLNGLAMDAKTQNMLFAGLTQPTYVSIHGTNTNLLGHLLEKNQWAEPNHGLVSEVLWLLADRDGYHKTIKNQIQKDVDAKVLRHLKDASAQSKSGTTIDDEPEESSSRRVVKRKGADAGSFFRR